ncbi:MAG TPA: TetR family transcriptional regulator [Cellvibrio sp.]|nr:TetR family transcriptional regulator [Cellvibrio sp.]
MARKTKEDALETRGQLLDAAEKVFFEKGFSQTSLMDIAEAANLTRGAIYWHFKNKSDLFDAMADRIRLPMENLTHACADINEPDPLGKLRDFWIQVLRETSRNPRRRRVLSILFFKCELNSEAKPLEIRRQTAFIEYLQDIKKCLANAVEKGQLPADLDVHCAAVANQALLMGLISNWLFLPGSFDLDNYAEIMIDNYLHLLQHGPGMRKAS